MKEPIPFDFVTHEQEFIIQAAYKKRYGLVNLVRSIESTCSECGGEITAVGCSNCFKNQLTQLANASACVLAHRDEITKQNPQAGSALELLKVEVNKASELLGGKDAVK